MPSSTPNGASCSQPVQAYPLWRPTHWRNVSCSLSSLLQQIPVTLRGQVQIRLARFLRLFLETMQHVNSVIEPRHIQYSECPGGIANPNFLHPAANCIHVLPVVRLAPMLDLVELVPRLTPGSFRKRP